MKTPCTLSHRKGAILAGLVLVLTVLSASSGRGQEPAADNGLAWPLWLIDPLGKGTTLPTQCAPNEDRNGASLIGNPLLDSGTGTPGWVGGAEFGVVVPHVMNRLFGTVTPAGGAPTTVQLPSAQIETAFQPRFELGYRFGQAAGELILSYRFVTGQATNFADESFVTSSFPAGVFVRSRLDLNTVDLDYGSWEPLTVCGVDMKWRIGLRGMFEYNDSQANNGVVAQSTTNNYAGVGPHAMVDFRRPIAATGLAVFARIEGSMLWGALNQDYTDSAIVGGVTEYGQTHEGIVAQVTTIGFQAGLAWTPAFCPNFHITAGYIFEHFFDVGSLAVGLASREELDIEGGFLRAEWRY